MMRMRIARIRNGKEIQNNLRHVTRKMVRFFFCLLGYWKITFTKQLSKEPEYFKLTCQMAAARILVGA